MSRNRSDAKLQRWIDLIAELLTHRYGLTLEQLRVRVPGYVSARSTASVARMFERDKDELRANGIPIETIDTGDGDEESERYRVDPREMYLPFLALATGSRSLAQAHGADSRRRLRSGYRSIPTLRFEPDELSAIVAGARLALTIDDPAIVSDARAALRKFAHDFPVDIVLADSEDRVVPPRERATATLLRTLSQALCRLKQVTFIYRSMARDATATRTVEPYGVVFLSGHWYLVARDINSGKLRNFRVSRIQQLTMNTRRPLSPDFAIPTSFRLSEHASSRAAWELGNGDAHEMVVEFRGNSGTTRSALRLGKPSPLGDRCRTFSVRRLDVFARWILSFAGEAVPLSPNSLVKKCREAAHATLAVYGVNNDEQ